MIMLAPEIAIPSQRDPVSLVLVQPLPEGEADSGCTGLLHSDRWCSECGDQV